MEIFRIVLMPRYRGLAVIGKDLDHALVNEDPQGKVLSFLKFERRIAVADCQSLARGAGRDREAVTPVFATQRLDPELTGRGGAQDDLQLQPVAGNILQDISRITLDCEILLTLLISA